MDIVEKKTSQIAVIGFDYGGVIEISDFNPIAEIQKILEVSKEDWQRVYFSYNHLSNKGNLIWHDIIILTAKEFTDSEEKFLRIEEVLMKHSESKRLNHELIDFITDKLQGKYKIALISNYSKGLRPKLEGHGIDSFFDYIIISNEVGYQKPEPEIFNYLFEMADITADKFVFIDDTPRSLETAGQIGYTPVLFTETKEVIEVVSKILGL
jgi:putative hydrolase of the HAD superfamily